MTSCDHLGSPRHVTDGGLCAPDGTMMTQGTGQMVGEQAFGPYGEQMIGEFNGKRFPSGYRPVTGYTGHINEDQTGLIYMRGRYYSPLWHRFVNSDQGADPNSLNQYAYVGGRPFSATDPSGMDYRYVHNGQVYITETLDDMLDIMRRLLGGGFTYRLYSGGSQIGGGALVTVTADPPPPMPFAYNWLIHVFNRLLYGGGGPGDGGGPTGPGAPAAEPAVPTEKDLPCEVRYAIMDAVNASNSRNATDRLGGYHEEGGVWGMGADGTLLISPAVPSAPWKKGESQVFINEFNSVNPSIIPNMASILGKYHVHPRGGRLGTFFQPPSRGDIDNADPIINIVAAAEDRWIYFYGTGGKVNDMSFKDFMKGCPPK